MTYDRSRSSAPAGKTTYVFYDTETTGVRPRFDQAVQIAFRAVDADFNPLPGSSAKLVMRCRPRKWTLPSPGALAVTHTDPAVLLAQPGSFYGMMRELHFFLQRWAGACFIGYNTLGFDEEVVRQGLWENLFDPYPTSKGGSTRADVLRILQAAVALDPNVLVLPDRGDGKPSFRLDRVAVANGFTNHHAHDALGDVDATIFVARLLRERSPALWARMMANADPKAALSLLRGETVLLATHFGASEVRLLAPVVADPVASKQIGCFDLGYDPTPYVGLSAEALAAAMATDFRALRVVKANQMPAIDSFALDGAAATSPCGLPAPDLAALGGLEEVRRRLAVVRDPAFAALYAAALAIRKAAFADSPWLEQTIYDGFPSKADERAMRAFHDAKGWPARWAEAQKITDPRMLRLAERVILDVAPALLSAERRAALEAELIDARLATVFPALADSGKPFRAPFLTAVEAAAEMAKVPEGPLGDSIRTYWGPILGRHLPAGTVAAAGPVAVEEPGELGFEMEE